MEKLYQVVRLVLPSLHGVGAHALFSLPTPSQLVLRLETQRRCRRCVPARPHVVLHSLHAPQGLHPAPTVNSVINDLSRN